MRSILSIYLREVPIKCDTTLWEPVPYFHIDLSIRVLGTFQEDELKPKKPRVLLKKQYRIPVA